MSRTPNDGPDPTRSPATGTADPDRIDHDRTDHGRPEARRSDERGSGAVARFDDPRDGRRDDDYARGKFGGMNLGAGFFGWLVASAVTILLVSIAGAVAAAVGDSSDVTQTEAQREAGTIGIAAAVVLLVVMALAYLTGGYVAGRMSRFDGTTQGLAVWLIGLVVTIVAVVLGAVFGAQYNLLDRVSLPRLPVSLSDVGWGGLITAVAVLVLTLVAAMAGGKLGERYHHRVDRAIER